MRRSPLPPRRTWLKRSPLRRGQRRSAYATRPRDLAYLAWVRTLPCRLAALGDCRGPVEADHAGRRGLGQRAPDETCIALCARHHADRHDVRGWWRGRAQRPILDVWIAETQRLHEERNGAEEMNW